MMKRLASTLVLMLGFCLTLGTPALADIAGLGRVALMGSIFIAPIVIFCVIIMIMTIVKKRRKDRNDDE